MKKIFLIIFGALMSIAAQAQLAKWSIQPKYDDIRMAVPDKLIETDSAGYKSLWTLDGKKIYTTKHTIMPFKEGYAVVLNKDDNTMVGFVDMEGKFTSVPENTRCAFNYPYFSSGMLMYQHGDDKGYIKTNGEVFKIKNGAVFYPLHQGFTPYLTYDQPAKKKDPYYLYYSAMGRPTNYVINGKAMDITDLKFLSNITYDGRGIAVYKNKLYWYDANTGDFSPMLYGDEESEKKRHLNLDGDYNTVFENPGINGLSINAKYGNKQHAVLTFDAEMVPLSIVFNGEEMTFPTPKPEEYVYRTSLKPTGNVGNMGIMSNNTQLLPNQFNDVSLTFGDKAFVNSNGKWGMLKVYPNSNVTVKINKGKELAFRHKELESTVYAEFPTEFLSEQMDIEIDEGYGIDLNKITKKGANSAAGNYIEYDCILKLPENLESTELEVTYPMHMTYDGIKLIDIDYLAKIWFVLHYDVDIVESDAVIKDGQTTLTFKIDDNKLVTEGDMKFDVLIEAASDSIQIEESMLSISRRKCDIYNLQEGDNVIYVSVKEEGCPPSIFEFTFNYHKPEKKKEPETVTVTKKSSTKKKKTPAPDPAPVPDDKNQGGSLKI